MPPATSPSVVDDGARLAALRELQIVDTEPEEDFDRFARLASDLIGVPISAVSLIGLDRHYFKAQVGLEGEVAESRQLPLSHSLCKLTVEQGAPLVIDDAVNDPRLAGNLGVRDLGVGAYAGVPLTLSDGSTVGAFCAIDAGAHAWSERDIKILEDLAAAVRSQLELRRALIEQSLFDPLTGLAGRHFLRAHAFRALEAAGDEPEHVGVVCVGIDGFRLVNEALGPAEADEVLRKVAATLAANAETEGTAIFGRLDGDVFALIGTEFADEVAAARLARRLKTSLTNARIDANGRELSLSVTAGVAMGVPDEGGVELIAEAVDAMNRAKRDRRWIEIAEAGHTKVAQDRLAMRAALPSAIERGEINVAFQPIVDIASRSIEGFEALIRWTHPEFGVVSPEVFVSFAEETGDIIDLDEFVMRTACAQLALWRERSGRELTMSVNVSPLELSNPAFPDLVAAVLERHGLPAEALTLELTERIVLSSGGQHVKALERLHDHGVKLALDDFGTGYSSLSYLTRYPLDSLKIDRAFVSGIDLAEAAPVVRAILALAAGAELDVVAEGVETEGEAATLLEMGAARGQGYLFARPVSAAAIERLEPALAPATDQNDGGAPRRGAAKPNRAVPASIDAALPTAIGARGSTRPIRDSLQSDAFAELIARTAGVPFGAQPSA